MGAARWGFESVSPAQWPGGCGAGWLPYGSDLFTLRRNSPFGFKQSPPLCEEIRSVPSHGPCSQP